jgi:hypothetical protein
MDMSQIDPVYIQIAEKLKAAESKTVPKLIQKIANLEQARVMCELPNTVEMIAEKMALDKSVVEKHLRLLY